jgi:hypothetical protein
MEHVRGTQALVAGRGQHLLQVNLLQRVVKLTRQINGWN